MNHSGASHVEMRDMDCVIEGAADDVVRGHVVVVIGLMRVVCCSSSSPYSCLLTLPHRFFVTIFFAGHFVYKSCYTFRKKKKRGIFGRHAKTRENTTVLKKQKHTICVFKCWLNCQLASSKFCGYLKKPSRIQPHRGARSFFCVLSHQHDIHKIA